MNKKDAKVKAQIGCFAGDLRELMNNVPQEAFALPAKINRAIRKQDAYNILHNAIANYDELEIVVPDISWKILYEFSA